jgi:hypothetical protein
MESLPPVLLERVFANSYLMASDGDELCFIILIFFMFPVLCFIIPPKAFYTFVYSSLSIFCSFRDRFRF